MTEYRIERCRSHEIQSTPMGWHVVAEHDDEQSAIDDLFDFQTVCHASGDAYRITIDGVRQDVGCDASGCMFLVPQAY